MRLEIAASETIRPFQMLSMISSRPTSRCRVLDQQAKKRQDLRFDRHDVSARAEFVRRSVETECPEAIDHPGSA